MTGLHPKNHVPAQIETKQASSLRSWVLLLAAALHLVLALSYVLREMPSWDGYLISAHKPFGGDFINLWTTGILLLSGNVSVIYDNEAFLAFQQGLVGSDIGFRVWAYPPTSLVFAWPAGVLGYHAAFAIWSLLGLALLAVGSRTMGLTWPETTFLATSPAVLVCIYYGQSGNLFGALLLLALAPATTRSKPVLGALLTIKAQTGFLLASLWLLEKRWKTIFQALAATIALMALSVALFGTEPWSDYFTKTVPALTELEKHGRGPFMLMIPSFFMSLRLLGIDGDTALLLHGVFALLVFLLLLQRLLAAQLWSTRAALVLVATSLITPYIHHYDLAIVLAGALLWHGRGDGAWRGAALVVAVALAWAAPYLTVMLVFAQAPIMPVVLLGLLWMIHDRPRSRDGAVVSRKI